MRTIAIGAAALCLAACSGGEAAGGQEAGEPTALSYDGADYATEADKIAHGERVSQVLNCEGCHRAGFAGRAFPPNAPEESGIYAGNLTHIIPEYSLDDFVGVLREGVHPTRDDLYFMPAPIYQYLSDADVEALFAYLQSLEPAGEPTPPSKPSEALLTLFNDPEGLEELAAEGLERRDDAGKLISPTMADEVAWARDHQPPALGDRHALGRHIAMTGCAECHDEDLSGAYGPSIPIVASMYDKASMTELLTTGKPVNREEAGVMSYMGREVYSLLTENEREAVVNYVLALAEMEQQGKD